MGLRLFERMLGGTAASAWARTRSLQTMPVPTSSKAPISRLQNTGFFEAKGFMGKA
jgi:hypothetical protein